MRTQVFIFNNASRAANYGVGTYVRQLSEGLVALTDAEVSFVEMFADTKEFFIATDEQGKRHFQIPALASGMESELYCRSIFYFIARNIETYDADNLVFQFNYFQHRQLAAMLKGKYPYSRIIVTVHYLSWCFELKGNVSHMRKIVAKEHEANDDMERRVKSSFTDEKAFLHLADEVIVLSRKTEEILAKDYEVSVDKVHLVYNGIGNCVCRRPFSCDSPKDALRNILYVGRLDEIKGVKYLISAFEKIIDKHSNTHLVIVGDGDFQPYLVQGRKIHGHISFLGKMQSDEVDEVYQSAYVGVMPSFHEQCSYTAIEMMRHGIPVVGTDSTGLAEMLDATPQLRIHIDEDSFDEEAFVAQIVSCVDMLLSDTDAYRKASDGVSRLYEKRYQISSMTNGTRQVVLSSFGRKDYTVSPDYFKHLDFRMMQLVNQRPDIDTEFFGLSGIGIYMWWRIESLTGRSEEEYQQALLQEYLIYYIDWLGDVASLYSLPKEMVATLMDMYGKGFYKTKVGEILKGLQSDRDIQNIMMPSENAIISNCLRICNCKV